VAGPGSAAGEPELTIRRVGVGIPDRIYRYPVCVESAYHLDEVAQTKGRAIPQWNRQGGNVEPFPDRFAGVVQSESPDRGSKLAKVILATETVQEITMAQQHRSRSGLQQDPADIAADYNATIAVTT
jgi:hypothetical protein